MISITEIYSYDDDSSPDFGNDKKLPSQQTEQAKLASFDGTNSSIEKAFDVNDNGRVITTTEASVYMTMLLGPEDQVTLKLTEQAKFNLNRGLELEENPYKVIATVAITPIAVSSTLFNSGDRIANLRYSDGYGGGLD